MAAAVEEKAEKANNPEAEPLLVVEDDEEDDWSSDSDIGDALEAVDGAFTINSRSPNANGGSHSRPNSSALQPLVNRNQRFTTHINASPLEEWVGRMKSNSVTAILESVRDMATRRAKTTEKADHLLPLPMVLTLDNASSAFDCSCQPDPPWTSHIKAQVTSLYKQRGGSG